MARSLLNIMYQAAFTNVNTGKQHNATQQLTQREIEKLNNDLKAEGITEFQWITEKPSRSAIDDAIACFDCSDYLNS